MPSAVWRGSWPTLVAESLRVVADPLATRLVPGPVVPPAEAARALAASLRTPRADDPAPSWLRPQQRESFHRAVAALRRFGGALLADPVGSGKTYIALAIARLWNGDRPTLCLVPAGLASQWLRTASALDIGVAVHSHERLSRGRLPQPTGGVVIIDESHHYRNPATRRYHNLCRWLRGQRLLLLSATPIVNRAEDLAHQLLLSVRDDALRPYGLPSLAVDVGRRDAIAALCRLVVSSAAGQEGRPTRTDHVIAILEEPPREVTAGVEGLELSPARGVASLIGGVLWSAMASGPGACVESLRRYRRLMLQAQDASESGLTLSRAALNRYIAGQEAQLVLWQLFTGGPIPAHPLSGALAMADIARIDPVIEAAERWAASPDAKCRALASLLADGRRTVVFTNAVATMGFLRRHLGIPGLAWCFGHRAGIGATDLPREAVLRWFRPGAPNTPGAPKHLVTTDVTAEGLDLQAAERVVHYDLPWTAMRMAQRDGRALRLGSSQGSVDIVRLDPSPAIERRLRRLAVLERKARLPHEVGLAGPARQRPDRWDEILDRLGSGSARAGIAAVEAEFAGALAGFVLVPTGTGHPPFEVPVAGWLAVDGTWSEEADRIETALVAAGRAAAPAEGPGAEELRRVLTALAGVIRNRLKELRRHHWAPAAHAPEARRLIRRLRAMSRTAIGARDSALLHLLDRAIRHAGGSRSAPETARIAELATATSPQLLAALPALPAPSPELDAVDVRLGAVIIFRSAGR